MIKLTPKLKYLRGGFDNGNHGKCTGNNSRKRIWKKHQKHPDVGGSRVQSFS